MGSGGSRQKPGGRGQQASLMEEARVHALGKDLVSRLAMLLKTVRIHSAHNQALRYSVKIFVQSANSLAQHLGDFTLRGDADSVFINEIRIRPEPIVWENIVQLMAELNRRGAGGLNFNGAILPATARRLLEVLMEYEELDASEGAQTLNAALHSSGITTVSFLPRLTLVTEAPAFAEQEIARATRAIQIYTELLVTWQAYLAIQDPHVPDVIRGRLLTAVQASVDMLHEDPEWFISAACFRKPEGYQAVHAVNTAILSMALGYFMDLKRKLMDLGKPPKKKDEL